MKMLAIIFIISGFVLSCSSIPKSAAVNEKVDKSQWPVQMRGLAHSLEDLFPYVASQEEFLDKNNTEHIALLIQSFEKSVEMVPRHAGEEILGRDPIVKFAVSRLLANTHQAKMAFDEGHREFARNLLKENLGLCFSCHTTSQFGPENNFSNKVLSGNFRISPSEKAGYYVATRQFERASEVLENIMKIPIQTNPDLHEQISALQQYLALQVRVEKNPKNALRLVDSFLKINKLPYFVAVDVKSWQRSLNDWIVELGHDQTKKRPVDFLSSANKIITQAARFREDEGYESGYVDYLRATAQLHEGLRSTPDEKVKAEIYQLLGNCYETLAKSGTWDLPEVYFEACIRASPKSKLAEKCYKDYERVTVMGFSGSAGVFLPKSERDHMDELKLISGLDI